MHYPNGYLQEWNMLRIRPPQKMEYAGGGILVVVDA
jgi:hypothetical protein